VHQTEVLAVRVCISNRNGERSHREQPAELFNAGSAVFVEQAGDLDE
jgi:hypothetical protein